MEETTTHTYATKENVFLNQIYRLLASNSRTHQRHHQRDRRHDDHNPSKRISPREVLTLHAEDQSAATRTLDTPAQGVTHEKEHPSRKPTIRPPQRSRISVGSLSSSPWRHTRYLGTSVRKSAEGAIARGHGSPGSVISSKGQARELRNANAKKANACSSGRQTRFACTNPGSKPEVWPSYSPARHAARNTCAAVRSTPSTGEKRWV
eukprot:scaffold48688_cov36-Tisochrysis_lutea.AAC.2